MRNAILFTCMLLFSNRIAISGEVSAEELFQKMENNLLAANSLQLEYKVKTEGPVSGTLKGSVVIAGKNKVFWNTIADYMVMGEKATGENTVVSDGGKIVHVFDKGKAGQPENTPTAMQKLMVFFLSRTGFAIGPNTLIIGQDVDKIELSKRYTVSGIAFGKKENSQNGSIRSITSAIPTRNCSVL